MGFKPSPEWSCRFYYLAEEFIRGNELDESNPFFWDKVVINVLGNPDFNASLPKVMKLDSKRNRIAGDILACVDDLRAVGYTLEHARTIARRVASYIQHLGIQDAPRKRRASITDLGQVLSFCLLRTRSKRQSQKQNGPKLKITFRN